MKLLWGKEKKQKKAKTDSIIIRNGEKDVRVYPKSTLLSGSLQHEKKQNETS